MEDKINNINIELATLTQLVKDGFKRGEENDQTMLAKQEYTNGSIGDAQRERTAIDKEIAKMKTVSSIFRGFAVLIIIPLSGYLLINFVNSRRELAVIQKEVVFLQNEQIAIRATYEKINESIAQYLTQ